MLRVLMRRPLGGRCAAHAVRISLATWLCVGLSMAQDDEAAGRVLYNEGLALMSAGDFAKGCPKLEESLRLKYNLNVHYFYADCLEKEGRTASAWAGFLAVESKAKAQGEAAKANQARARADAVQARLARLTIRSAEWPQGFELRRGGVIVGKGLVDTALPVDPGDIDIVATAPGRKSYRATVHVAAGESVVHEIPALEVEPAAATPSTGATDTTRSGAAGSSSLGTARTLALVGGAAGIVLVGVGIGLGVDAKSRYDGASTGCGPLADPSRSTRDCYPEAAKTRNDAASQADIGTALFVGGGALVAAGALLWILNPGRQERATGRGATWQLAVAPQGVALAGSF